MIVVALFFIFFGIIIKYGKMYNLIAGYNTNSKEEQEKVDIEGIATVFRNGMFGMAFTIFLGCALAYYLNKPMIENGSLFVGIS